MTFSLISPLLTVPPPPPALSLLEYFGTLVQELLHFERGEGAGDELKNYRRFRSTVGSTAVKLPKRFSFYLVGFYLMLNGNMGKDV